ncbi:hypothetical protein JCM17960_11840 [Magnetospira thiophila]
MFMCFMTREMLIQLMPLKGQVAEIGVAQGDFSAHILHAADPARLTLIDPWTFQDDESYRADLNNAANDEQQSRYQGVLDRFATEIQRGQVVVKRQVSQEAVADFADGELDWLFIDGMHTEDGVYRDLSLYWDKVKDDGFILGHDYTNIDKAIEQGFGVIEAVDRFVQERDAPFIALTAEVYPAYVLAKRDGPHVEKLRKKLLYLIPQIVEIREPFGRFRLTVQQVGDKKIIVRSF